MQRIYASLFVRGGPQCLFARVAAEGGKNKGSAFGIPAEGRQRRHDGAKAEKLKAEIGGQRATWSGGLAEFQFVNHAPNAVGLAALDD
ncbi:MAG: hypothetical protein WCK27_14355, partial [Verrucomicrobiota bacterium]